MALQVDSWQISRMCEMATLDFRIIQTFLSLTLVDHADVVVVPEIELPVGVLLSHIHSISFSQTNDTESQLMFKQNTGTKKDVIEWNFTSEMKKQWQNWFIFCCFCFKFRIFAAAIVKYVRCALIYLFVCKSVRETKARADIYICARAHI